MPVKGQGTKILSFPLAALLALAGCREAGAPDPEAAPWPEAPAIAAPRSVASAPLAECPGEGLGEAAAWNHLALVEQQAGNFALSRVHFRRALRILAPLASVAAAEAVALYRENLARLMTIEGERAEAQRLVLPLPGEASPSPSRLAEVAWLQLLDQRPEDALATLDIALEKNAEPFLEAVLHDRRGTALERLGRLVEARAAYLLALDLARGHAPASTAAATRANLCRLAALAPGGAPGDEKACADAVAAARRSGVPAATLASALFWQALEMQRRGRLQEAYPAARQAAGMVAALRLQASSPERRSRFLEDRGLYVELAVELAMAIHRRWPARRRDLAALADSELWRARTLAEETAGLRHGDPLHRELREARRRLRAALPADRLRLEVEAAELETRWRAARSSAPIAETFELGALQRQLDAETTVFDLVLGERRSYLWRIEAREIASFELPAREVLEQLARSYFDLIASPTLTSRRTSALEAGTALAEALFGEGLERLEESGRRLVFVGDGDLAAFPLAALPIPPSTPESPTFLVETKEIVALPSLRLLTLLHGPRAAERQPSRALALVGDPWYGLEPWQEILKLDPVPATAARRRLGMDPPFAVGRLPFAGLEMERVASHAARRLPVVRAQGPEATRELALSGALEHHAVVHFSAHGELDPRRPERSAILLAEVDREGRRAYGRLTPDDLADLGWRAELAVASSCDSGRGLPFRFEGLGGLARGFFYAGASRALASLWKVEGRATAQLMDRFYAALADRRLGPGEALRAAQHALLAEARVAGKPWRAPYYWSGFALIGDWRAFSLP